VRGQRRSRTRRRIKRHRMRWRRIQSNVSPTRGGGTRGAAPRRGFGNNNNSNRNGGVNGIGEEDGQYEQYYNELGGYDDTPSLNNVNGELNQENY
jgi:hypothetical protein